MTVENLEFDHSGRYMIGSTDKKFILVVCFGKEFEDNLGTKVSSSRYVEDHYGSSRAGAKEVMKTYKDLIKVKTLAPTGPSNSKMCEENIQPGGSIEPGQVNPSNSILVDGNKPQAPQESSTKPTTPEQPTEIKTTKYYKKGKRIDPSGPTASTSNGLGMHQAGHPDLQSSELAQGGKPPTIGEFSSSKLRLASEEVEVTPPTKSVKKLPSVEGGPKAVLQERSDQLAIGQNPTASLSLSNLNKYIESIGKVFLPPLAKMTESGFVSFGRRGIMMR